MPALTAPPTGTVTFLFTDIQGSTRLWEQFPDAMRPALARHDFLVAEAIADHGGYVFKTVGDAFCAAFPDAAQALQAALAAQMALDAAPWETAAPLRVRMALHTGSAEERGGDYFGPPLNRVARLMATGHGGQTLLSGATQAIVQDALPSGTSLVDLGRHRLKDLGQPEHVHQVSHPALAADFPPLRSLGNPSLPNNLPQQPTSFIGREKESAEIKRRLSGTRLLTLTGAGGSGKTRLSLQVAADLLDGEGDGVWLVELAALFDPALVPQAVADVLEVPEQAGRPVMETLTSWLKPKRLLLLLDNCEHLVSACAEFAAELLQSCPGVHILSTSREPLGVPGEQVYRVPTLSAPDPKQAHTAASLLPFESVRLFTERAKTVQPSFGVTDENAAAVSAICARLDGIPLALELAAARVRSLPVEQINLRLDQRFRLLTGGSRTALPRQQTLRALVDWSYDLLTESEKTVLCRLSVFAGGWTLEAAEAVCSGENIEAWEVPDLLTSLVSKSLAVHEDSEDGTDRYRLLETVRQYAGDLLTETGKAEDVQARAASWFLKFAEEVKPKLSGPEQGLWLSRLETEHDNLRASLSRFEVANAPAEAGLQLAGQLWQFWARRGHLSEGRLWLNRALAKPDAAGTAESKPSAVRARALNGSGSLAFYQGDYKAAWDLREESLAIFRQIGDQRGIAATLMNLGLVAGEQGDYKAARALHTECLAIQRQLENRQGIALALNNLGIITFDQGDYEETQALFEESLALQQQMENQGGIALALMNLGNVAYCRGEYAEAQALHGKSLALCRQLGDLRGIALSLNVLGDAVIRQGDYDAGRACCEESLLLSRQQGDQSGIARSLRGLGFVTERQGDHAAARALYAESLTIYREMGDQRAVAGLMLALGEVAQGQGQIVRAARLLGAAAVLRETIGTSLIPTDQQDADRQTAWVRDALGEEAFQAAWAEGRAMMWQQAAEYALSA